VTKGRGDGRKRHWVTKFRLSYSNDSQTWHFYKHAAHLNIHVIISQHYPLQKIGSML